MSRITSCKSRMFDRKVTRKGRFDHQQFWPVSADTSFTNTSRYSFVLSANTYVATLYLCHIIGLTPSSRLFHSYFHLVTLLYLGSASLTVYTARMTLLVMPVPGSLPVFSTAHHLCPFSSIPMRTIVAPGRGPGPLSSRSGQNAQGSGESIMSPPVTPPVVFHAVKQPIPKSRQPGSFEDTWRDGLRSGFLSFSSS